MDDTYYKAAPPAPASNHSYRSLTVQNNKPALPTEDNTDQYSLASSLSQSSYNSRADNSLIFERLVQDPLTDAQPIPHSLPRHISSETFIPASLDTTTHMIKNNEFDFAANPGSSMDPPSEFGFSSRRSSLANLQAALGPSSRRPSNTNLQSPNLNWGSYKLNSASNSNYNLSRSNTNSSFSNLTQQLQNSTTRVPQNQTLSQSQQQRSPSQPPTAAASTSNLPPLTTTLSSTSVGSSSSQRNLASSHSPLLKNKSFCSYADIIAQDDHESKFSIRRPSISTSLSGPKMGRTNSINSTLGSGLCGSCNSPRSPANCSSPFSNNFRNNSLSANSTRFRNNSPSIRDTSAIDSDDNDQIFSMSNINTTLSNISNPNANNTPRKLSGFSGRSLNTYSMRVSNSNTSQNMDEILKVNSKLNKQKDLKDLSPASSRQSDEGSIKSFKTASLTTE